MNAVEMTPNEIRQHGINALARELGPVGMIRFLQQFELGTGDYTLQRAQWLPADLNSIEAAMLDEMERSKEGTG